MIKNHTIISGAKMALALLVLDPGNLEFSSIIGEDGPKKEDIASKRNKDLMYVLLFSLFLRLTVKKVHSERSSEKSRFFGGVKGRNRKVQPQRISVGKTAKHEKRLDFCRRLELLSLLLLFWF